MTSAKMTSANKGDLSFGRRLLSGDRASIRFILANIGGAAILMVLTLVRSIDDDAQTDFTYEFALLFIGLAMYVYTSSERFQKTKLKGAKTTIRDQRGSMQPRGVPLDKASTTDVQSRRQQRLTPSFTAMGWEAEIQELILQVSPTQKTDAVLQVLSKQVSAGIKHIVPEAQVSCFAFVNLVNNNDVGSLEAEVAIELESKLLAERMEAFGLKKMSQRPANDRQVSERKCALTMTTDELAKMTLRMLTRELAQQGFFLYHHCSYKEREPKVVLRLPADRRLASRDIFVSFTVNSQIPARANAVSKSLQMIDQKAFELGSLARRWARDRGIAYAAKGHLAPYAWSCLVAFFLQQRCCDAAGEKPTFGPPLGAPSDACLTLSSSRWACDGSVAALFQEFLLFYVNFDWRAGIVSLRLGRQIAWPESSLEPFDSHPVGIEDPYDPTCNQAETLTSDGFRRLIEEFERVRGLLDSAAGARLKDLLEAWVPTKSS